MITATLATCEGREESLEQTINSLKHQVDKIMVYANYEEKPVPEGAEYTFMTVGDLADMGKLVFGIEEGYHLTCDDDLTYPSDYAQTMIHAVDTYDKVVSLHGCNIQSPVESYYKERTDCLHCLAGFGGNRCVMIPGSGVMAYNTDMFKFNYLWRLLHYKYMADIYVAVVLQRIKRGVMAIGHPAGWLKHNDIDHSTTIWSIYHDNDKRQAEAINEIKEWKLW